MDIILECIEKLFGLNILVLFIGVGLFLLIVDVPILRNKKFKKESIIAKFLGCLYIFGSITLFIIAKII